MLAASLACPGVRAALPDAIFAVGRDDGSCAEFKLARGKGWERYAAAVTAPVVFTAGQSSPADWPYIHPSTYDTWAGSKLHPFTVRFTLPEKPAAPLHLVIGQLNAWRDPHFVIAVNGKPAARRAAPPGDGAGGGTAEAPAARAFSVIPLPADLFAAGANELTVTCDPSWVIYDFLALFAALPAAYLPPDLTPRAEALRNGEYGAFDEIVFATRNHYRDGHWYANFGYYALGRERPSAENDPRMALTSGDSGNLAVGPVYGHQGRLCALNLRTGKIRLLIDDPEGAVRDPCVSYDARKILFSYRPAGTEHYHLHEINADGTGLTRLTDGGYDDIEPCYHPDGGILFVSSRLKRWVNCWATQVATVHTCHADGSGVRPFSVNIEQDNTPWPLRDGRILFMRWEYVDRNQVNYHHLWTMNPDGTQHSVFFGNLHPGGLYIDGKPIPGSDDVLFIDSPGHGSIEHRGFVARVSAKQGPDAKQNLRRISKAGNFRDPWALADDLYLAARDRDLVLLDDRGTEKVLYSLPAEFPDCWLHEPRPLAARPRETLIADRTDPSQPDGFFFLENVYEGRQMDGVEKGAVKKLMVLESLPKPINFTGGMDPLSYVGTFTLPRVLGTVPVEADGSAYFAAPALRPLFFVALDAQGRAVKRMQSFTQLMPGERQGCTGCHEERASAPRPYAAAGAVSAARRKPSAIDAADRAFDVPDFPRHVQPVLDRHCVRCHNPDDRKGGVDLCGDRGPMFSMGYYSLVAWRQVADGRNYAKSNYAPYELGSGGSPLMQKLDGSHHDVKPPPGDVRAVALWLDASAPYPGTYAALGTGMIGGYQTNNQNLNNDKEWPTSQAAREVFEQRCASCHADKSPNRLPRYLSDENGLSFWAPDMADPRLKRNRHAVFNLTRPEKSLYLLAPLARSAGGLGLCGKAASGGASLITSHSSLITSTDDPAYRALLAMIDTGRQRLDEIKRFDMPGFRPRPEYLRELVRYGLLPADFDPASSPCDPYALDRLYWDSFIYRPSVKTAAAR
jgi:mono/diheme cytochrome c family protein